MIHYRYLLLPFLLMLICSCGKTISHEQAESYIIDSFTVTGITMADELLFTDLLNDSMLFGYDREMSQANFYLRSQEGRFYKKVKTKQLTDYGNPVNVSFGYNREKNIFYYIDGPGKQVELLDKDLNTMYKQQSGYRLPLLKNRYMLAATKTMPVINIGGDTVWMSRYYTRLEDYKLYSREHLLSELVLNKDTVVHSRELVNFPVDFGDYFEPTPQYCYVDRKLLVLYPDYDTLYIYDRAAGKQEKVAIGNKDFVQPEHYDFAQMSQPDFTKYQTRRNVSSFRYWGVFFNERTQHYILFYKVPALIQDEETLPSMDEFALHGLVLDRKFKTIRYVDFAMSRYFLSPCFFNWPGKGIVIPKFSKTIGNDQTVKFYIFNF